MPADDRAHGKREPRLGLLSNQGRAAQARAHGGRDHNSVVLLQAGIPPSGRRAKLSWKQFLAAQAQTLVVADFLSVDTVFFKRLYVLIYMHLATRRVLLAACTANPNETWMAQQARNLAWTLEEEGIKPKAVIHDRDMKFSARADSVFRSAGARVILTPLMAPRANAHVERWIGSCRRECLDRMLVVNERATWRRSSGSIACTTTRNVHTAASSCDHQRHEAIPSSPELVGSDGACGWAA